MVANKIFHGKFPKVLSFGKILGIVILLFLGSPFHGVGSSGSFIVNSEVKTVFSAAVDLNSGSSAIPVATGEEANMNPVSVSAPAPDPVNLTKCVGENAIFSVSGGSAYQWQESIGNTAFVDISGQVTNTLNRNSVTYSMNGNQYRCIIDGGTPSAAATLTVYQLPVITTASTANICSGMNTNINLTASVPSTFTWTIGTITGTITGASTGSGSTISQVLTNPSNYTTGTVQYLVTPISITGTCTGATFTLTVTVYPTPIVTNSSTASICSGNSTNLVLSSSVASSYTWTVGTITGSITGASSGNGTTINQTLMNPSNSTAGTVVYNVTATSTASTCSSAPFTITVTVNPIPSVTTASTFSICSGTGPNISLTSSTASTFSWTVGTNVGSITGATASSGTTINQILTNPSSANAGSVIYNVTPLSSSGNCTGAPFAIKITVNPAPVVSTPNTATICSGTSPAINLTSSIASSFTWTVGAISGTISGAADGSGSTINQTLTNPSSSLAGTVEYIVTPTSISGNCAGPVYTITVTVSPALVVTTSNTASSCSGTSTNINLTASIASTFVWTVGTVTGGITGASPGSGTTIIQTLTNPSSSASGTVIYNVTPTATSGSCVGPSYPITVTVNPAPIVTNSSATTICSGSSPNIALTSSIASSFAWTVGTITGGISGASPGSGTNINQTLTNPSNSLAGTVEYIVIPTATSGTCAGTPLSIIVTVNPAPVVTTSNSFSICSGTSPNIGLTASIPSGFIWTIGTISGSITGSSAGSGATINQALSNASNTSAGSVQYIVTPTSTTGACVGATYTITVTVNPSPLVTTSSTATICSGLAPVINLTASTASSFTWTVGTITGAVTGASSGSGGSINQTLTNSNNPAAGTVIYNVTATSNSSSCLSANYPITVTVNPTPIVTNSPTANTCSGTSPNIVLTSTAPSSYAWTIGTITGGITGASVSSGATINQTLTNPSNATAGTVEYKITPTASSGGCVGATYTITVTVYPLPEVTTPNTASICNGTGPNITLTATASSNFSWIIGAVSGSITGASSGSGTAINQILTNPSHVTSGTVEYIVTPSTITGACAGPTYSITITVDPSPVLTSPRSYTICSGAAPNITLNASTPSTYTWVVGVITGGITGASTGSGPTINQTLTNPSNSSAGTVEYLVTPTESVGGLSCATFSVIVTVNPKPAVTNFATANICNDTSTNIALTSSVPSNFSWTIGTNIGTITGQNAGAGVTINDILTNPSDATVGSVAYLVTPISITDLCTGSAYPITVSVNPGPGVTTPNTATTCSGVAPNISLTASAPSTFAWTIGAITGSITGATPGSGATINQVLTNPSGTSSGTVQYIVTPTATTGSCVGTPTTITVTVNPAPTVTTPNTATICSGGTTNISLTSSTPSGFVWTVGAISGGITGATAGSGTTISQTLTNPNNSIVGTIAYIVTPTSTTGSCVGSPYTITVTVNSKPALTNSPIAICSGSNTNLVLGATIPSTYSWTLGPITGGVTGATASSGPTINQTLVYPGNASSGTVPYIITPTSATGGCAGSPVTIVITVNSVPDVTIANTKTICSGTSTDIALTASAASAFDWTIGTITGGITGASAGNGTSISQVLTNPGGSTSGTLQYIVTPTATAGSCAGSPYIITVTVNPVPIVTTASTSTICSGGSTNIILTSSSASTYTWTIGTIAGGITGATAGAGGTISQTLTNPSNSVAGSVEYLVTPTASTGSCIGTPYSIFVTVNPTPIVTTSPVSTICNLTSPNIVLAASTPSTFAWTIASVTGGITGASASSGSTINQVLTNPGNSTAGTVVYSVTPTSISSSCPGTPFALTVTVNPAPSVTTPLTATICSGNSPNISLSATVSSTFAWTIGNITSGITGAAAGSGLIVNQVLTNPNATAGTVEYIVTPTSTTGNCVGASSTILVTVNPSPVVTNPNTSTICSGSSPNITLTSSITSTYSWVVGTITGSITGASGGTGGTINQTLTNPSNTTAGTVQYIVTPTSSSGSCVGAPYTITITVNPKPIVTNSATASTCSGIGPNIVLTSSFPSSFSWTIGTITGGITGASSSSGTSINQVLTNPSNTDPGTVAYVVTPTSTSGSCAGTPYTITITVNPSATISTSATATICSGNTTNISLAASLPSNFAWTIGANVGGITGASAGSGATISQLLTNPNNTVGSVEYIVTPTSTTGSYAGVPYTITVTVNPAAVVLTPPTKTICSGSSPNIGLTASVPSTFAWNIGTITGNITGASAGIGATINQVLANPSSTASGTIEYLVTPTASTGSCAGTPYSIVVTVNPKPIVTNAITSTICSGTSPDIALTSSVPSTFTWIQGAVTGSITGGSDDSGPTINQVLTNPSDATTGTVAYIVTPTSTGGSCVGTPLTITVSVNPVPTITTAATATICSGTSPNISLAATAPSSFTWTIGTISGGITGASAGFGGTINQILTNPSTTSQGTVEYLVTPTSITGSCTGTTKIITVSVNPAPAITNPATKTICNGTSTNITLTGSVPSTYVWTLGPITGGITGASAGSGGTINQTLTNPSNLSAGTVEYIVTPTATTGSCVGASYSIVVTVNPYPIVTTAPTAIMCSGTSPNIALTASIPSSFTWTIGTITGGITGASATSGSSINQTLTNPSITVAGTVQYIVMPTSTSASCVGSPYIITVTVNPAPIVTNSNSVTICSGTSPNIGLTASIPSSFTWTVGTITGGISGAIAGSGATINQTLTNPSSNTAGSVVYIITPIAVSGNCIGAPYILTVTVNPAPVITTPNTATICSGSSPNISLVSSIPGTFTWTVGIITGSITGASAGSGATINQTLTNPGNLTAGTVEYLVTPTATIGSCPGTTYSIVVTVNPNPRVTNAPTAITCSGTSPNIALTASIPSSFTWTIGTITGGITGASATSGTSINQTLTNPSSTVSGAVQYIVTPTSTSASCVGAPYAITVTVNPAPVITTPNTTIICSGSSPNIGLAASVPSSFTWTVGAITGGITGASAGSGGTINQTLINPSSATAGSVVYIITPTAVSGNCAGAPYTITVTVNPAPVITTSNTATICSGSSPNISLTSSVSGSFTWTVGAITGGITGASAGTGSTINQVLTNPGHAAAGTVEYIVTSTASIGSCQSLPYSIVVTVNPIPVIVTSNSVSVCSGSSSNISLTASTPSTFTWTVGAITGGITGASVGSGSVINQILTNPSDVTAGTVTYLVVPTSTNGSCPGSPYSIVVTVNPTTYLTSATSVTVCSDSPVNYIPVASAIGTTFQWSRAFTTGISNSTATGAGNINETLTNTTTSPINVTYVYRLAFGGCISTENVVVTVNPKPILASTLTPAAICNHSIFSYTPSSQTTGATYSWLRPVVNGISQTQTNGVGVINETLDNTTTAPITVTYLYTITANGCSNSQNVTVDVGPSPVLNSSLTPPSICSNSTFSYTPTSLTAGTTFAWSRASVAGILNSAASGSGNPNEILYNSTSNPVVVTYVYTLSVGGCANPTTSNVAVTVNPTPSLNSSLTPGPICSGTIFAYNPTTLTISAIITWSRANVLGISQPATTGIGNVSEYLTNTTALPIDVTYIYTTTLNGCSSRQNVIVTVYPQPVLNSSLSVPPLCSGYIFNYLATSSTPGATFAWSRATIPGILEMGSTGTGNVSEVLTNTTASPILVTYNYTVSANGCPNPTNFPVIVVVYPIPPKPVITAAGSNPFCEGSSITLTSTVANSYEWSNGLTTQSISVTTAGSYSVVVADVAGCNSAPSNPFAVLVNPAPSSPISGGNITQCVEGVSHPLTATATVSAGNTLSWWSLPVGGVAIVPSLNSNSVATQTFYAESTNISTGCKSLVRTPVTISVVPLPAAPALNPAAVTTVCETNPITLLDAGGAVLAPPAGSTIKWYTLGGSPVVSPTLNSVGSVDYYAETDNGSCTSLTRTKVTLTINPAPATPVSFGSATKCAENPIVPLTASATAFGSIINWYTSPTGGAAIVGSPSLSNVGTVTYYAEAVNPVNQCVSLSRSAPVVLTINATPAQPITNLPLDEVCQTTASTTLTATAIASGGASVRWYNAASGGSLVASPTLSAPGTVTYWAEAFLGSCSSPSPRTTSVKLTIDPAPAAPVFSEAEKKKCYDGLSISVPVLANIAWFESPTGGDALSTLPSLTQPESKIFYAEAISSTTLCRSLTRTAYTLTILTTPSDPISGGDQRVCAGATIPTLTATATSPDGFPVKFYRNSTGGTEINPPVLNSIIIGGIDYWAEADNGICKSKNRTKVHLQIDPAPASPVSKAPLTLCANDPQIATGTFNDRLNNSNLPSNYLVEWFNGPTDPNPMDHIPTFVELSPGKNTFYAGFKDQTTTCQSQVRTEVIVTINALPLSPISKGDVTACALKPVQVIKAEVETPTDGAKITWYTAATGGSLVASPTLNRITSITYYAQADLGTCPNLTRTPVKLTINPIAADPVLLTAGVDSIVTCESAPIVPLYARDLFTLVPGKTIVCYDAATDGFEISSKLDIAGSVTMYAAAKDTITGCISFGRVKVKLVIHAAPPAPISTGDISECALKPVQTLDANKSIVPISGINLVWYNLATGGSVVTPTLTKSITQKDTTTTYFAENVDKVTKCPSLTRTAVKLSIISTTASASSNSPVAMGQTLLLKGGPELPGNTYLWKDPAGFIFTTMDVAIPNVTQSAAGWYHLFVTSRSGCVAVDSVNVMLDIAHAEAQTPVCVGATLYLAGYPANMKSYAWSGPNGFSSSLQNPSIPKVSMANAGTYTLTVTNSNNATSSDTVSVSLKALPIPIAEYSTVCPAGTMQLKAGPNGMTSYLWSSQNGSTWPAQNPPAMPFPSPAENFTLTVVDWNGCEASKTITPVPFKPIATSNSPICAGDTLRLRGEPNGMASYRWSGPNGFLSSLQSPTINNVNSGNAAGDYTLTVIDQAGCTFSTKVAVAFNPAAPVPTIAPNINPICAGSILTLNGGPYGMSSYDWTGPNGFTSKLQSPQILNMDATNAGKYTLSITNPTGCKNSADMIIGVNSATMSGTYGPYCLSDLPVSIIVTPQGGTFSGPGIVGNTFDPKLAGVGSHTIQYTYSLGGGACSIINYKIIEVVSVPMVVTNNLVLQSCTGTTADLTDPTVTAGSTPGLIFSYYTDSKATAPIAIPKFVAAGTYFIKGSTPSGKCSDIQPVLVGQPDSLRANITALAVLNCAHDTTGSLSVNITMGTAPFTYRWSTVLVQTTATATNLRSGIYTVVVTDAKMCTAAFTGEIVEPAPIKLGFTTKPIQCLTDANGTARVDTINGSTDVSLLNSYKYLWATNPVQTTREAVRLTAKWHKLSLISAKGCVQKDSVFIDVLDVTPPSIVCPKDIELTVPYIKSLDGSPNKYVVDLGKALTSDNCTVDTVWNDAPAKFRTGLTYVVWTVRDQVGLTDTCTQRIYIKEIPTIPQLISPNGDGVNDTFVIDGLNSLDYRNSQMLIFTRSGQLVFQSNNYELPENAWNGRYTESSFAKNSLVAPGVYYYILKLGGSSNQTMKGYIYVYY